MTGERWRPSAHLGSGGAGLPLGWWESGVRGISITGSGQPAEPGLAEDGWRTISWQRGCLRCALTTLITPMYQGEPMFFTARGVLD